MNTEEKEGRDPESEQSEREAIPENAAQTEETEKPKEKGADLKKNLTL
jgi:hypothetical protein